MKKNTIRGNHGPFESKELRKDIYARSRLKSKMCQNPISQNINAYKKTKKQMCHSANAMHKKHLAKITQKGVATIYEFWNFSRPFLTNKGFSKNKEIILRNKKEIITDEKTLPIYLKAIL